MDKIGFLVENIFTILKSKTDPKKCLNLAFRCNYNLNDQIQTNLRLFLWALNGKSNLVQNEFPPRNWDQSESERFGEYQGFQDFRLSQTGLEDFY